MWTGLLVASCSLLLLFFLFLWSKGKLGFLIEVLSLLSFRLAVAFLVLFILNVLGGYIGLDIPVNLFSAFTIALLGMPGVCSVGLINYFL